MFIIAASCNSPMPSAGISSPMSSRVREWWEGFGFRGVGGILAGIG